MSVRSGIRTSMAPPRTRARRNPQIQGRREKSRCSNIYCWRSNSPVLLPPCGGGGPEGVGGGDAAPSRHSLHTKKNKPATFPLRPHPRNAFPLPGSVFTSSQSERASHDARRPDHPPPRRPPGPRPDQRRRPRRHRQPPVRDRAPLPRLRPATGGADRAAGAGVVGVARRGP